MTTTTVTLSAPGSVVITENDVAMAITALTNAVIAQTAFLTSTFSPAPGGVAVPGSVAQSANQSQSTLSNIVGALNSINKNLEAINIKMGGTAIELKQLNKHTGIANSHANKANVISQLAVIDQINGNQFDQAVVKETQIAAGQPPTEVKPGDFKTNTLKKVQDIANLDAATAATGIVIDSATKATTQGLAFAQEVVLETAVGKSLVDGYYEAEIAATTVFSKEKADRLIKENEERKKVILGGGVPTPPVAPS